MRKKIGVALLIISQLLILMIAVTQCAHRYGCTVNISVSHGMKTYNMADGQLVSLSNMQLLCENNVVYVETR